jgi:Flp pilus assembly protein TadB
MQFSFRQPLGFASAALLATAFAVSQPLSAQATDHLVSPGDLQQATQAATQTRQQNIDTLREFLSSPEAQKALEQSRIDPQQVQNAVAGLSDQDLAQLAARANKAHNDFAAGNMSQYDLLIILIAVAVLILIIVAVR